MNVAKEKKDEGKGTKLQFNLKDIQFHGENVRAHGVQNRFYIRLEIRQRIVLKFTASTQTLQKFAYNLSRSEKTVWHGGVADK